MSPKNQANLPNDCNRDGTKPPRNSLRFGTAPANQTKPIKLVLMSGLLCHCSLALSVDFYVSTAGSDQADGMSAAAEAGGARGPFFSLSRAQQAIREQKTQNRFNEPITVHIQPGIYSLPRALTFDIRDTGFADRPIRWQGEGSPVIISAGVSLNDCTPDQPPMWSCNVKDQAFTGLKYRETHRKQGAVPGFELFVNNRALHLARWPNSDWAHVKIPFDDNTRFSSFEPLPKFENNPPSQVQAHIFAGNDWYDQYIGVNSTDVSNNTLKLANKTAYKLGSGRRFYLQNIKTELDAPGEWFYDRNEDKILFIPIDSANPDQITASYLPSLLTLDGVHHLSFSHMSFRYSTEHAIKINKSEHLDFTDIEVNNIGGKAIELKNSSHVTIADSHIHDTGEGGILLSGGDRTTLHPAENIAHNNRIHDFGRVIMTYMPAIELAGVGNRATHNLVADAPGSGILVSGNDHVIEKNEIHHVCEQASDCGAIYSGRDWTYHGNIIRHNSIHDLFGYGLKKVDISQNTFSYARPDGVRAIYLDDEVSGFSVIGNLLYNPGMIGIQLGGGRHTTIENNIIVTDKYAIIVDQRLPSAEIKRRLAEIPYRSPIWSNKYPALAAPMHNENWPENNRIVRNILITTANNWGLRYRMPDSSNDISSNLVWNTSGPFKITYEILDSSKKRDGALWTEWVGEGIEKNSVEADPCLTITGNIPKFCPDTPTKKISFQALPEDIGLIK
ncbi:right-handed parallel beta-helix repeat-containing protein [Methylomonas sp. SURF-1]|uniref:Right-handed parallel beta-helix repeat-containing protein n=1 Tax=Methylomonas aurea TaxID=2952224 RepID=A0ABT1UKN5_9GAMM|nr:right-handed parallel beta-helix repeat-containing protein [Methylomonas sp. SURF-1]MCQ8182799.1 right-handed parallel beta-helix repeat-containing protein [Methylomonas sp. SURF-1]